MYQIETTGLREENDKRREEFWTRRQGERSKKKRKTATENFPAHLFGKRRLDQATVRKKKLRRERKDTPIQTDTVDACNPEKCTSLYRFVARMTANSEDIRMWGLEAKSHGEKRREDQKRSARSPPATELFVDEDIEEKPVGGLSMSCTATLGTCGTGNLRCVPSDFDMMSVMLGPM